MIVLYADPGLTNTKIYVSHLTTTNRVEKLLQSAQDYLTTIKSQFFVTVEKMQTSIEYGEAEELRQLFTNARRYLPDNIVSSFDEFKAILTGVDPIGVPYPYPTLQSMTLGMRPYESVLITAQEGWVNGVHALSNIKS